MKSVTSRTKSQSLVSGFLIASVVLCSCANPTDTNDPAAEPTTDGADFNLHELAAERGWTAVAEDEVRDALSRDPSLLVGLDEQIVLVTDGVVYRVPANDIAEPLPPGLTGVDGSPGQEIPRSDDPVGASSGARANDDVGRSSSAVVIGGDDRISITPTVIGFSEPALGGIRLPIWNLSQAPYRQIARLQMQTPTRTGQISTGVCSGAFFGPRHVLTAGHCLVSPNGIVTNVGVAAGASGAFVGLSAPTSSSYFLYSSAIGSDLALVILPDSQLVANTGWFGWEISNEDDDGHGVRLFGYPGAGQYCVNGETSRPNYPFCGLSNGLRHLYTDTCAAEVDTTLTNSIYYDCDQTGGMSGGPLFRQLGGSSRIMGVAKGWTQVLGTSNYSTRLTPTNVSILCGMAHSAPSAFASYNCMSGSSAL